VTPAHDPENTLGFLLSDVMRLMRRDFQRRMRGHRLTLAQWRALAQISLNEGINQARLADNLEIQPITLARVIDKLEEAGWVERRRDPRDRRAVCLHVTAKAQPLISLMWDKATRSRELAQAGLPPGTRERLIDILRHMKRNLAAADAEAAAANGAADTSDTENEEPVGAAGSA
jgi:MarR family transcriptional regulator, transcriptional regulator for hemolysin